MEEKNTAWKSEEKNCHIFTQTTQEYRELGKL